MIDAHLHFEEFSLGRQRIDAETGTVEELLEKVGEKAQVLEKGGWILGFGWNHNAWGGILPHRAWLDRVAPEHPVFLRAKSGHAGWANSRGMEVAGIGGDAVDPEGGALVRDEQGALTGVFLEEAQSLVQRVIPEPSAAEVAAAMVAGQEEALGQGLTGVHDLDDADIFAVPPMEIPAVRVLGTMVGGAWPHAADDFDSGG